MKKSKALFAGWILLVLYLIFLAYIIYSTLSNTEDELAFVLGVSISYMIILPHLFFVLLALFFNILGWSMNLRWAALTGGILYAIAALNRMIFSPFVLLQIILSFVGFVTIPKLIKGKQPVVYFRTSARLK